MAKQQRKRGTPPPVSSPPAVAAVRPAALADGLAANHLIDVADLRPNNWNPYSQPTATFEELCREIREDGFSMPLLVVAVEPTAEEPEHYRIIDGEHRWKAARAVGLKLVPCVIAEGWDEQTQKLKTVRRNMMVGDIDRAKFTKLYQELAAGKDPAQVRRELILTNERKFRLANLAQGRRASAPVAGRGAPQLVADLTATVKSLLDKYGATIPQGFVFFPLGGQMHLIVGCTPQLDKQLTRLREASVREGKDLAEVMSAALPPEADWDR